MAFPFKPEDEKVKANLAPKGKKKLKLKMPMKGLAGAAAKKGFLHA